MDELKPCPCGKTPTELHLTDTLSGKWTDVCGNCCGEWTIEYRNNYETGDKQMKEAIKQWNLAPRASETDRRD